MVDANSSRKQPEVWVIFGAFGLLAAGALISLLLQTGVPDGPPLGARAYGVTGGLALTRWVEALGYRVHIVEGRPYQLSADMRVLLVLQPNVLYPFQDAETEQLVRWVRGGGTLVVALEDEVSYPVTRRGPQQMAQGDSSLLDALGFGLSSPTFYGSGLATVRLQQPFPATTQPWTGAFRVRATGALSVPVAAQPLATDGERVIVAAQQLGSGQVVVFASTYPFSNEGLSDEANGNLVLSLLRSTPPGSVVGFDEYHHGARQTASIPAWLLTAPAGQAVLLALVMLLVYILWTGRRMGRVFTPPELRIRRQPSEYVVAMANLARIAGQRQATLLSYRDELKVRLGKPYRIDPHLGDEDFVAELAASDASVERERLLVLLCALTRRPRSSAEFVSLARQAADFKLGV